MSEYSVSLTVSLHVCQQLFAEKEFFLQPLEKKTNVKKKKKKF